MLLQPLSRTSVETKKSELKKHSLARGPYSLGSCEVLKGLLPCSRLSFVIISLVAEATAVLLPSPGFYITLAAGFPPCSQVLYAPIPLLSHVHMGYLRTKLTGVSRIGREGGLFGKGERTHKTTPVRPW